jgi:HSP90 family molecular chaperone
MVEQQSLLYDERFLESYAGNIMADPATAMVELIANCWDAYATLVRVTWPDQATGHAFKIGDNGEGMTLDEFKNIWRTIAYNRIAAEGPTSKPPSDVRGQPRVVFGKNGKGRFATFCFADEYTVRSRKNGQEFLCKDGRRPTRPLASIATAPL